MLSCCSCHWCYFILIAATSRRLRNVIVTILKSILNKFHRLLLGRGAFLCYSFLGGNQIDCFITSVSLSVHCNTDNPPLPPKRWITLKIVAFSWSRVKELEHKLFPCIDFFHTGHLRIESHVVSSIAPNWCKIIPLYPERSLWMKSRSVSCPPPCNLW